MGLHHPHGSLAQPHTMWTPVFMKKELVISEIGKAGLYLSCSLCHKRFSSCWSLCFKFGRFHIVWDVLLAGFFCEAGFQQVMVQIVPIPAVFCASCTFASGGPSAKALPLMSDSSVLPSVLGTIFPSTSRHRPSVISRSCRCQRTSQQS